MTQGITEEKNTQFNEYLEQEGISKDDIINAEIEQEHKEAQERKKQTNLEILFAPEDEQKEFDEKINNKNYFALETTLTIKFVDFVDISKFNSEPVIASEYQEKLNEFIKKHQKFNSNFSDKINSLFKTSGLFMTYLKEKAQKFNPANSSLHALKDCLLHGNTNTLEEILKNINSLP